MVIYMHEQAKHSAGHLSGVKCQLCPTFPHLPLEGLHADLIMEVSMKIKCRVMQSESWFDTLHLFAVRLSSRYEWNTEFCTIWYVPVRKVCSLLWTKFLHHSIPLSGDNDRNTISLRFLFQNIPAIMRQRS
jgi:hypothetical protein